MPLELATELWRLLGFAQAADDDVAFTEADVEALRLARDLQQLGVLSPERQAALVRTWGRSFARLAEWQTELLASVALERDDPAGTFADLSSEVLPRVERLQGYVWRRHLAGAGARLLGVDDHAGGSTTPLSVVFADIVGYTSRSKELGERELVAWLEHFESRTTDLAVEHGARVIKNIGDEVLLVADDPAAAVTIALTLTAWGEREDDDFPRVRAGVAHGEVVSRLGDVFGPTVNVASRLTSVARPGTVVVDEGVHDALRGEQSEDDRARDGDSDGESSDLDFRRIRRLSVKGYPRLRAWAVRQRTQA